MAASPDWKVYDAKGEYQAACKEVEAAGALMGFYGDGATIRWGHTRAGIVWTEGQEAQPAGESFDHVAEVANARVEESRQKARAKHAAKAARHAAAHRERHGERNDT